MPVAFDTHQLISRLIQGQMPQAQAEAVSAALQEALEESVGQLATKSWILLRLRTDLKHLKLDDRRELGTDAAHPGETVAVQGLAPGAVGRSHQVAGVAKCRHDSRTPCQGIEPRLLRRRYDARFRLQLHQVQGMPGSRCTSVRSR